MELTVINDSSCGTDEILSNSDLFTLSAQYREPSLDENIILKKNIFVKPLSIENKTIGFDMSWRKIEFDQVDIHIYDKLKGYIDGKNSIKDIIDKTGINGAEVLEFLQFLYKLSIVDNVSDCDVPSISFHDYIVNLGRMLKQLMLERADLLCERSGLVTKKLLLGYLIETYHVVSSSSNHMSQVIANTTSGRIRFVMSRYLNEEYLHGELLKKGLLKAGVTSDDLKRVFPLPQTMGIINFIVNMARTSEIWYGAFLGITEMPTGFPGIFAKREEEWRFLEDLNLLPKESFSPFREHDRIDQELDHGKNSIEFFLQQNVLSKGQQDLVVENIIYYIQCLEDAYLSIKQFYTNCINEGLYILSY